MSRVLTSSPLNVGKGAVPTGRPGDLNERVYTTLRVWLGTGELKPREQLSLERVASKLNVSRTPVYHALTRLVEEGLVSVQARRGYFVTPLTQKMVSDAYDVRLALELSAAEKTVGRLDEDQLLQLRRLSRATEAVTDSAREVHAWHQANQALHEYQIDLAANPTMSRIFRRLSINLLMERALTLAADAGRWLPTVNTDHEEIVSAYEAGDLPRATAALRAHNATGRQVASRALAHIGGSA
jgi:DNA-binding GntR family transcriptional regulator